jgi:hypothetical protein
MDPRAAVTLAWVTKSDIEIAIGDGRLVGMMWRRGSPSRRKPSRKPDPDPNYQRVDPSWLSAAGADSVSAAQAAATEIKSIASWSARLAQQFGGRGGSTGVPELDAAGRELMQASARATSALRSVERFLRARGY